MHRTYGDRANFLTVYIKEAHATDEWSLEANDGDGVCYRQPKDLAGRVAIARDFVRRFAYEIPLLVDDMDNRACQIYGGWPERLYVVGEDGKIVYKGLSGPFGFHPEEVGAWLAGRFGP